MGVKSIEIFDNFANIGGIRPFESAAHYAIMKM